MFISQLKYPFCLLLYISIYFPILSHTLVAGQEHPGLTEPVDKQLLSTGYLGTVKTVTPDVIRMMFYGAKSG